MSTINILLEERIKELQANVNQLLDVEQELKSARQELESCKKLLHLRSSEKPVLERLKEVIPDVDPSIQERQPADLIDMHISLDSDSEAWDYVN